MSRNALVRVVVAALALTLAGAGGVQAAEVRPQAVSGRTVTEAAALAGLRDILEAQLDLTGIAVTPTARLKADLKADTLDLLEIVLAVEDRFGISISDAEAAALATVGDYVRIIVRKTAP